MSENPILWSPTDEQIRATQLYRFMQESAQQDYDALYRWSIEDQAGFWRALAEFCSVEFTVRASEVLRQPGDMTTARWFPGSELSFASHLLRHQGNRAAIVFRGENGARRELSFDALRSEVASIAAALRKAGVSRGDRVAGFLPNCPEAVIGMLATTSLGAVWSSCSPDFGINGVVDRFGQIEPKILLCADGYYYNGKRYDSLQSVRDIAQRIDSIELTVVVPFTGEDFELPEGAYSRWQNFKIPGAPSEFASLPFDHPTYIMFSSGTTGVPKCIVHGAGGTLLQHQKEHVLHCDVREEDRMLYFTTCGWMMWNWLVSALASGTTIVLFDGAPFFEDGKILWRIAAEERITVFGTSAKYLSAQAKHGTRPKTEFDLSALRLVLSTGSPLAPEGFDYVYDAVANDIPLSSIAGGTDIISCFILGNPILPVRRGELQCRGLGMAVETFDDAGQSIVAAQGELVCTRAFPSMPIGFWDDPNRDRYHAAYFERFPGVWAHGDNAEITRHGGAIIYGRSDTVLNPGGVRIGTAEIYRQVETLEEVLEAIAIAQKWEDDVRIVLFVVLKPGIELDDALRHKIVKVIRDNTTPRHVPSKVLAVPDIPRTMSGKIVELAVRSVVHGETVKNTDALANPEALEYFRDRPELLEA